MPTASTTLPGLTSVDALLVSFEDSPATVVPIQPHSGPAVALRTAA